MSRQGSGGATRHQERVEVGATVEVEIERILPGGAGLAHACGHTILVALAAPGDHLRVRIERRRGSVAFASITQILKPSVARVEPPCPYFGRCGGCDFQQLTYEAQLAAKVEIIRDCLRRIARLEPPGYLPITPAPAAWQYRSRARWQYDPNRGRLGYYELASHRVVDVIECPVIVPALQEKLTALRAAMQAHTLPKNADEFQAVAGDDGVSLAPPTREDEASERTRVIDGEHYHFNADCFFQINHQLLEPLIREAIRDEHGEMALDLYCGVGLFTLPLARRFTRVMAVEGSPTSAEFARHNLAVARLTNAGIQTAHAGEWFTGQENSLPPIDFLLLDPPRAGAEPEVINTILGLRPRHIAYVSCDPATLARDLRSLTTHGYRLDSIAAFDLFPQTHHVETIARLSC